jgi:hypothetical protein
VRVAIAQSVQRLSAGWTVRGWNPGGGEYFAPVHTGPGAHPASYTMDTGSFLGEKRPGRSVDHPPTSRAEVKERVELYLYSPSGHSWPVLCRILPLPYTRCSLFASDISKGRAVSVLSVTELVYSLGTN